MKHKLCSAAILALAAVLLAGGSAAAQDEVQVPCHTPAYTRSAGQIVPPAVDNTQAVCTHDGSPVNGAPSLSGGDGIIQWLSDHSVVLRSILSALGSPTLPSGASTAANQTAVQSTAGSAPSKVVGVQGVSGGTLLAVSRPDVANSAPLAAGTLNAAYTLMLGNGAGVVGFNISGLTSSGATLTVEAANDGGTTWSAVNAVSPATGALATTLTVDGNYRVNAGGHTNVRLRVSVAGSGTITVYSNISAASALVALSNPLPAGTNTIGAVTPAPTNPTGMFGGATVGTSSASLSLPNTPHVYLSFHNPSQTATICLMPSSVGSTATISGGACNTAGELTLLPLADRTWEGSAVPADSWYAIASAASTPLTIGAK